jgi:putative acetyltransferase
MTFILREETPADPAAVRRVVSAAFGREAESDLVDRLRSDGDAAIALVAVEEGRIVGHILFSPMGAPFRALALAPVAVLPERQRQGIGSALIQAGLDRATGAGWEGVFVLGEPAFYGRFGFEAGLAGGFQSPYAGPYLMARALPGPLPALSGRIDYAPAFAALS